MTVKSKDIKCGDIVQVERDSTFPCDLLFLYSNSDNGTCHVKTSNLDGETNLKIRYVPSDLPCFKDETDLNNLRGVINCEKPNARLYEFNGKLITNKLNEIPLSNENILLRGTCLKIASIIYGCAIYTGCDTKMMLNSKFKSNKLSCVEKRLNKFVIIYLILLIFLTLSCLFGSIIYEQNGIYRTNWYLIGREPIYFYKNSSLHYFITFIFYMNINYLVPLSLYVTLEIQRFMGSKFFEYDLEMYNYKTQESAKVNSSDLNEDLGQIEYLFTDKTGTLTENEMIFKYFAINGHIYEEKDGLIYKLDRNTNNSTPELLDNDSIIKLIECLTLCHNVQLDLTSKENYNASSPDELSFIKFCAKLGIIFEGDEFIKQDNTTKIIRKISHFIDSEKYLIKNYELLQTLEFDSKRKRMSVIVRNIKTNEYILYCKGADSSMFKKLHQEQSQTEELYNSEKFLYKFSCNGWRTLVLGYRILTKKQYEIYQDMLNIARNCILDRETKLDEVYDLIESDLVLNGVTAVEDRLQEDVESTLQMLREAGIKIWMLTGDKLETAVNISNSCKHFTKEMIIIEFSNLNESYLIKEKLDQFIKEKEINLNLSFALIIDGYTLSYVYEYNLTLDFRLLATKCDAVLCCRMTPAQKALIVKLIKLDKQNPMTCAIGDGANDVSMIQEANVGIGLFGKEGRNAAVSADFAFSKFKYLKRALLVHGYLYYTRASSSVLYFFYKNFVFAMPQAYFACWNAFSTGSLYNSLFLTMYNLILTSVPVFTLGLMEQKITVDKLCKMPKYYKTISKNKGLAFRKFFLWTIIGIWHSLVSFFVPVIWILFNPNCFSFNGHVLGGDQLGAFVLFNVALIVHFKLFIIWRYQTYLTLCSFLVSLFGFIICIIVPNSVISVSPFTSFTDYQNLYYIFFKFFETSQFWFTVLLVLVIALTPDLIIKCIENLEELHFNNKEINNKLFERINSAKVQPIVLQQQETTAPPAPVTSFVISSDNQSIKSLQDNINNNNNKLKFKTTKISPSDESISGGIGDNSYSFQSLSTLNDPDLIKEILEPAHELTTASYV